MTPAALGVSSRSTKELREFDSVREKELRRRELERRRRLEELRREQEAKRHIWGDQRCGSEMSEWRR